MTVELLPLRHSVPVAGFIFREKEKPLNIRKEAILKYSPGIKEIKSIKEGNDLVTADGKIVRNADLTLPPYQPRSYAFCTDTSYFAKLPVWLKDVDLLYYESTFSDKDKKLAKLTGHSTALQAAKLAQDANVKKLLMGHFSQRYKIVSQLQREAREIFAESYTVEDGEKYDVTQVRKSPV
jgi:ribonuclease Z